MSSIDDLKVGVKLIGGFLIVTAILVVVGMLGYSNINSMNDKTTTIIKTTSLVDAAMEMKISVRSDMQMIMEILAAEDQKSLDEVWVEHEKFAAMFDTFADAILNGAETDEGTIYATEDEALRAIVTKADNFHNDEFQPRMMNIRDFMSEEYKLQAQLQKVMGQFEGSFEKVLELSESFEGQVKKRIDRRMAVGASASDIMATENSWADMAMEMKTTLAMSRISVEEMAQSLEAGSIVGIAKEYQETIVEFDSWVDALLQGAVTDEGKIAAVSVPGLREMVVQIDNIHNNEFQAQANAFMALQKKIAVISEKRGKQDAEADAIGEEMMEIIGGIEDGAKSAMDVATKASEEMASLAELEIIIGIVVGFAISIFMGIFLARNITGPLTQCVYNLGRLAEGDLSITCATGRKDEIGILSNSMSDMMTNLRELLSGITAHAKDVNATSSDLFAISGEMSDGAGVMSGQADSSSGGAQEMSGNMNTISAAAEEMSTNMTNVAAAVEEMSTNMTTISAAAEEANTNLTAVAAASEEASTSLTLVKEASSRSDENIRNITDSVKNVSNSIGDVRSKCQDAASIAQKASDDSQSNIAIIETLTRSAREISNVVKGIDDIAQQTNMLALNASIEAAGAGEAGKGFSVVANEVKELASQTATATKDISQKISEIQDNTQSVTEATQSITDAVQMISGANEDILSAVDEQSHTIEQVNQSMVSAAGESAEVSRRVDESSSGIDEVNRNMQEISSGIGEVVRNVVEINSGIQELTQTIGETSNASGEVASNISKSAVIAGDMSVAMSDIKTLSEGMEGKSSDVKEKSVSLSDISTKLDESLAQFTL
jgi:methyl-accepting chemotaxis protein